MHQASDYRQQSGNEPGDEISELLQSIEIHPDLMIIRKSQRYILQRRREH